MAASMTLRCLSLYAVLARSLAGTIPCGNAAGPSCSNAFVDVKCASTDGACCHDAFNGWCCPHGFKCNGVFSDPGDNTHCMTFSKVSGSCLCEQVDYEIIAMEPVGETKVANAWSSDLKACCQYPTEDCGWSTTISRQDTQEVSWSNTAEVGYHMTWSVEATPVFKLGEIGFEVKDSFTYGKTSTTSTKQEYTNSCLCSADHCKGPFSELTYKLRVVYSEQPVQIKARKCGVTKTLAGTVKTSQWVGDSQCHIDQGLPSCPGQDASNTLILP